MGVIVVNAVRSGQGEKAVLAAGDRGVRTIVVNALRRVMHFREYRLPLQVFEQPLRATLRRVLAGSFQSLDARLHPPNALAEALEDAR